MKPRRFLAAAAAGAVAAWLARMAARRGKPAPEGLWQDATPGGEPAATGRPSSEESR